MLDERALPRFDRGFYQKIVHCCRSAYLLSRQSSAPAIGDVSFSDFGRWLVVMWTAVMLGALKLSLNAETMLSESLDAGR